MLTTKIIGEKYENMATHYLKTQKYKILTRNFICPVGEIDIIAYDKANDYIVFVEVKYRTTALFGRPLEAITEDKQRKIRTASQVYLKLKGKLNHNFRYDAIEIIDDQLRHIVNAF